MLDGRHVSSDNRRVAERSTAWSHGKRPWEDRRDMEDQFSASMGLSARSEENPYEIFNNPVPNQIDHMMSSYSAADAEPSITECLQRISDGDRSAVDELFRVLYPKLRQLAENAMRRERPDHTLQATALVNEAVTRLLTGNRLDGLKDRRAFFALASLTMRAVLVDHARRRAASKRPTGDHRERTPLDDVIEEFEAQENVELLALDEALEELKSHNRRQHDVVNLHFFGGLRFREIAEQLNVSISTVEKDWRFARAWLLKRLDRDES